jgi:putative phosphoesterase
VKRIGLLSDTHGFVDPKIYKHFKDVDEIWHAGDVGTLDVIDELRAFKPLRGVYGNIDGAEIRTEFKEVESFTCEGLKVMMIHIAGKPGRYQNRVDEKIREHQPKLFICGHSHILLVKMDPNFDMLWMNPGACGYKGFHQVKTLLRFAITEGRIHDLEVIELGKRV